jgi:hypothetical protein
MYAQHIFGSSLNGLTAVTRQGRRVVVLQVVGNYAQVAQGNTPVWLAAEQLVVAL